MATRRLERARPGLLARLAAEVYVGVAVVGAVIVAATGVALVGAIVMQVNAWVTAVD